MNIFVAPEICSKLEVVKYPHVKYAGEAQSYLYDEDNLTLYEAVRYADQFRSWFVDNLLCSDGHMNLLTRVNPLFIFLPQLMIFAKEQFRTLHDICQTFSSASANQDFSRLDYALSPSIDWNKVCDTRDIDDELFVRFSETKTLEWLLARHKQTVAALAEQRTAQTSRANLILEASDLIDQYIPNSLTEKFKSLVRKQASEANSDGLVVSNGDRKPKIAGGTKRSAPIGSPALASKSAASVSHHTRKPEPPKTGGIMNFFKPLNKRG